MEKRSIGNIQKEVHNLEQGKILTKDSPKLTRKSNIETNQETEFQSTNTPCDILKADKLKNKVEFNALKDSEPSKTGTPSSTPKFDKLKVSTKNLIKKSNEVFSAKSAKNFVKNSLFGTNSVNVWTDPKKIAEIIDIKTATFKDENMEKNFLLNNEIPFMKRNTIAFLIAYIGSLIFGPSDSYLWTSTLLSPLFFYSLMALYFIYNTYPNDPHKDYAIIRFQKWIIFALMTWFLLLQLGFNQFISMQDQNYSQIALFNVVYICLISFGSIQMIEIPLKLSGISIGISFLFYFLAIFIIPRNFEFNSLVWKTLGICLATYVKNFAVSFMSKYREDISKRVVFYLSAVYKVSLKIQRAKTNPDDVTWMARILKWKRALFAFNFYIITDKEFNKNYDLNQKKVVFGAINGILIVDLVIGTVSGGIAAAGYDRTSTFFWLFIIRTVFLFCLLVFYNIYYRFYIKENTSEKEIQYFYYISAFLVTLDNAIFMVEFLSNAGEITSDNRYPFYSRMESAFITACVNYAGLAMSGLRMPYYLLITLLAQALTIVGVFLVAPHLQYENFMFFLLSNLYNQIVYLVLSLIVARYLMKIWVSYDILQKKQGQISQRELPDGQSDQKSIQFSEIMSPSTPTMPNKDEFMPSASKVSTIPVLKTNDLLEPKNFDIEEISLDKNFE